MLLDVVAQSLKPVKLFSQQLPTFLLFRDRRSVAQQCWIRLHSSSIIVGATHAHYAWFTETYGLYPYHGALQVPTLLGVGASVYTQPKGCVMAVLLVHVVYSASYASFFAMELEKSLVNDDIRATCKTNFVSQALYQTLQTTRITWTLKNCWANKVSKITISICCNFIQDFHPCLPLSLLGYSYLLFMFWALFLCSTQSGDSFYYLNVDKLRDTAPLSHSFLWLHEASVVMNWLSLIYFVLLCIKSK